MLRYMRDPSLLFGIVLIVLGLYIAGQSLQWTLYGNDGPGPGFFPLIYGAVITVFAALMTATSTRELATAAQTPVHPSAPADRSGTIAAAAAWLALALSIPVMWAFGFLIGFGLALLFIIHVVFGQPWWRAALTAAAIVIGLYVGFVELLQAQLPAGRVWGF